MFDNRKVAALAENIGNFVKSYPDVYLIFEEMSYDIFPLLHRVKANVKAILVEAIPAPQKIFNIPVVSFSSVISHFNSQTAIIRVNKQSSDSPLKGISFQNDTLKITVPSLEISVEEVRGVYDRLILMNTFKELESDGIKDAGAKDIVIRTLRGVSTLANADSYMKFMYFYPDWVSKLNFDTDDVGIVIQGPLVYENDYTITTAQMYRKFYPNIPIVISTWQNEATDDFRKACKANDIVLIENILPEKISYFNINFQLKSSLQGVKYLKGYHTNVKFVLKNRSDQRIYNLGFLMYFKNLVKAFPASDNKLEGRLLAFGIAHSFLWMPFHLSDHLHFGFINDMLKLYSITPMTATDFFKYPMLNDTREKNDRRWKKWRRYFRYFNLHSYSSLQQNRKLYNWNLIINNFINSEMYLFRTFYDEYIQKIDSSKLLETYWKFLHDYIVIADGSNILLDWPKYESSELRHCIWHNLCLTDLDYATWLNLYNNFNIDRI